MLLKEKCVTDQCTARKELEWSQTPLRSVHHTNEQWVIGGPLLAQEISLFGAQWGRPPFGGGGATLEKNYYSSNNRKYPENRQM